MSETEKPTVIDKAVMEAMFQKMLRFCESRYLKAATVEGKADKSDILFVKDVDGRIVTKD